MALPTFLIIGAQKAATTSLHAYLQTHPDIFLPPMKEPNFFIEEGSWSRGVAWYEALFEQGRQARHRGEASPGYSMFPIFAGVPERIHATVPDVRLIYIVRDPVERMRSAYLQALTDGREVRSIDVALLRETRYLAVSQYALQLEQYLRVFSRQQILVQRSEDLAASPQRSIDEILGFLDLDPGWSPSNVEVMLNRSDTKRVPTRWGRPIDAALRRHRMRRRAWAERILASRLFSRKLTDADGELDPYLRGLLAEWLRPDVSRLVELVEGLDAWGMGDEPYQSSFGS